MYYPTRCVWACKKKDSLPIPITDTRKIFFPKCSNIDVLNLKYIWISSPKKSIYLFLFRFCFKNYFLYYPGITTKVEFQKVWLCKYNVSCLDIFQIILEAIPKDETDQARRYRGYIAVDDLYFESGDSCQGHCTFDSGMCGFLNAKGQDHFDWEVVRTF